MVDKLQFVCDNVVADRSGRLKIFESMFSSFRDLSADLGELAARLHPAKKRLFDEIASGATVNVKVQGSLGNGGIQNFDPHITIKVNRPTGGMADIRYDDLSGKLAGAVRGEVTGRGFDENAEPVIRQMHDGSFRVVFCSMPPLHNALGDAFDMDAFGAALTTSVTAKVHWDDRDVFYIERANEAQIREVLHFLMNYGKSDTR